jgi:hypothetical protein
MVGRWKEKMDNSPYAFNQYIHEENRRERLEENQYRKQINDERINLVLSMSGKAALGVLQPREVKKLDHQTQLAIQFRQSLLDDQKIKEEKQILDHFFIEEIGNIQRKFPALRDVSDALFRSDIEADLNVQASESKLSSLFDRLSLSNSRQQQSSELLSRSHKSPRSRSRKTSPSSSASHSMTREHFRHHRHTHTAGNNDDQDSMSGGDNDSNLQYHAPITTMQQLSDDLSDMSLMNLLQEKDHR